MIRKIILFLMLISISVCLCACVSDWIYEMPNDYAISNNAYVEINLVKITSRRKSSMSLDTVINSYIHEFAYNERYVAVKQFDPDKINFDDFESNDFSSPLYYLVDTVSTDVFGPYQTQEHFETACLEFDVGDLGEWIVTSSDPNKIETH